MKRQLVLVLISGLWLAFYVSGAWAQEIGREAQIKEARPVWTAERNIWRFAPSFEYSWIKQNGRKISWKMFTQRLTYVSQKDVMPFVETRQYERAGIKDYVADIGLDSRFKDSYAHVEFGFGGADIDYVYKFKSFLEYAHRIQGAVFFKIGQEFLHYAVNNVEIFSPGLAYYFGDNYLMWDYNISLATHRDPAQWTSVRGSLRCAKALDVWGGVAIGERLYDIQIIESSKQYSYIFFAGLSWHATEDISVRLGGSYSQEKPSFIKRSLETGVSIKF